KDLVHGRIAGALADAVDAGREDLSARAERHHGIPRAEAEVVVEVHDKRGIGRGGLDRGDVLADREWRVAADGVRGGRPRPPRLQSLAMDVADVVDVGAAAVLATELDRRRALLPCVSDRLVLHAGV